MVINKLQDLDKLDKKIEYKISNGLLVYTDKAWLLCMETNLDGRGWDWASYNGKPHRYGWWLEEGGDSAVLPIEIEVSEQELIW